MNKADREFIGYAVAESSKKSVSVLFLPKKSVKVDGIKCSGYFDEDGRRILVATKKAQKDYFPVFIHEFCHFQQWAEKDPLFMIPTNNEELDNDIWEWLNGDDIPMSRVKKSVLAYQKLELDCEKRAVEHIRNFGLSVNVEQYIKMANVYVLFYSMILKTRKWYVKPPYKSGELLQLIPEKFVTSFSLPDGFEEVCLRECY